MSSTFHPYRFDPLVACALRPIGVRPDRDGVLVDDDTFRATFGLLAVTVPLDRIADTSSTGPYAIHKVIGPRLSLADKGLTFGTTRRAGVCLRFTEPVRSVVGPWRHPALTVTVADPERLVADIAERRR